MQEQDDDDDDEHYGFKERDDHSFDGAANEDGGVVHHRVVEALREVLLKLIHRGADIRGELERVRTGRLEDGNRDGLLVVEQGTERVAGGAEFDAGDALEQCLLAVRAGLDDDVAELFRIEQTALGVDLQFVSDGTAHGLLADGTGCDLHILFAERVHDVARGQVTRGGLIGIDPDAHRVVAGAEELHGASAGNARQDILHLKRRKVTEIDFVITPVGGKQMNHHREIRRLLGRGDAEAADFFRQLRQGLRDTVLHLDLRVVDVRAELEGDGERHDAIARRLREHVEGVLNAVDGLLQRRGDGLGDRLGIRARVIRHHDNGRRDNFRILADRQSKHRDGAEQEDDYREHAGENRPANKEVCKFHNVVSAPSDSAHHGSEPSHDDCCFTV